MSWGKKPFCFLSVPPKDYSDMAPAMYSMEGFIHAGGLTELHLDYTVITTANLLSMYRGDVGRT